jgi:hypothetical protein
MFESSWQIVMRGTWIIQRFLDRNSAFRWINKDLFASIACLGSEIFCVRRRNPMAHFEFKKLEF